MTNTDIVNYVYKNYDVLKLIRKLISNARPTGVDGDLEQYIYMTLITMDNERLNKMFKEKTLKSYIARIIINQRNSTRYLNKYIRNKNLEYRDELPDNSDESEFDLRADFLFDEMERYDWFTGHTERELRIMYGYEVLRLYITGMSKLNIMLQFSISLSTLNILLREAKNNLKVAYDRDYDEYAEKIITHHGNMEKG